VYDIKITLRTARFNIKQFYMCLTLRVCVFVRISEQTATFALHNISRTVLYNRGGQCLLHGTDRVKYIKQKLRVFKGLIFLSNSSSHCLLWGYYEKTHAVNYCVGKESNFFS